MTVTDEVADLTIPDTTEGLEELLNDYGRMAKLGANKMAEAIRAYAKLVWDKDKSIKDEVAIQVQATMAELMKDAKEEGFGPRTPINFGAPTGLPGGLSDLAAPVRDRIVKAGLYEPRAMGAALDKEFPAGREGMGEYFRLVWHNASRDINAQAKFGRVRNAFGSEVPSEGGFLIPENLRSELLRVSLETSVVRSRARVIPMESLRVPFPMVDVTSNASSVYGGIVAYWTEEGAALTQSQAAFGRVVLDAKKLTAYTEVPNELISDSILSFEAFISEIFPEALGFYEDIAFLKGTGVGEPMGALSTANNAVISVTKEGGQASGTIVWENIVKMFARMLPTSLGRAVWVASIDTFPELATMALAVGTGGGPVWLNNGVEGPPMTILGRPVIFTEKAPAVLGTQGDISFVDFGFYLIGDRQSMSAMSSPHFKFGNDVTAYRIIERVDGRPWLQSAITPQNGGPTLSPFVQLQTR